MVTLAGDPRNPAFGEDRRALHHPGRHRREALLEDVGVLVDATKDGVGNLVFVVVPLVDVDEDEFGLGLLELLDPREIGFRITALRDVDETLGRVRPAFGRGSSGASGPPPAVVFEERFARRFRDRLAIFGPDHEDVRRAVTPPERPCQFDAVPDLASPLRVVALEHVVGRFIGDGYEGPGVLCWWRFQRDHRLAERFAHQQIGLGVLVVVMPPASGRDRGIAPMIADFDGLHVPPVRRMAARFTVHRQLGVGHGAAGAVELPAFERDRRQYERRVGCLELPPQRLDQPHQVGFVPTRMRRVPVLVSLPPDEARDLPGVLVVGGGVVGEVLEDLADVGDEVVVLLAGVPVDGRAGIVLGPGRWIVLVTRVDSPAVFEALAPRRQDVPAEASVALGGLDEKHRLVVSITDRDPESEFGTDEIRPGAESGLQPTATISGGDLDAPDIVTHPPVAGVVEQVFPLALRLDEMFEGAFCFRRADATEPDHVRLTHQDVDPDGR